MDTIAIEKLQYLQIGQQGENNALTVDIDMTSWVEEFPDKELTCFVLFVPPGEKNPWPMTSTWNATTHILTWEITASVTAVDGQGYMEVRALENTTIAVDPETEMVMYDGMVKKSRVIPTMIDHSISGVIGGSRSAPYQDFLNQVLTVQTQLNQVFSAASTTYAVSTSYQSAPESGWSGTVPDLVENKGKYLWCRTTISWSTGESSHFDSISYIAADASGAVVSINGKTGAAILDGGDIFVDRLAATTETIQAAINRIDETVLPASKGGTGKTSLYDALAAMVDMTTPDTGTPYQGYYALTAQNSSQIGHPPIIRRTRIDSFFNYLSASNVHTFTGGYVVKTETVTLTADSDVLDKQISTKDSKTIRVVRGLYTTGIESFNTSNIPIGVSMMTGFDSGDSPASSFEQGIGELSFGQPVFSYQVPVSGNPSLAIHVPFELKYLKSSSSSASYAASIKARFVYLAAT